MLYVVGFCIFVAGGLLCGVCWLFVHCLVCVVGWMSCVCVACCALFVVGCLLSVSCLLLCDVVSRVLFVCGGVLVFIVSCKVC